MSGGERAEPFPTGSGKIPPAMQGEVSVPCLDQDCGNRAGAGAHVVGGLLHVQLGIACQAWASLHVELGVGSGNYLQNIHLMRQRTRRPRGLLGVARIREARRVGVDGPR